MKLHNITSDRRQSKMLIISMILDRKLLKTEFLIAICCLTGDKWQSKTLFLVIFNPHSSIVKSLTGEKWQSKALFLAIFDLCLSIAKSVSDCRLSGVK